MSTWINNGIETFTFEEGMIENVSSTTNTEIDENVLPQLGPMGNLGVDVNGVVKLITVTGRIYDTTATVASTQDIRDKLVMKLWLEALQNGAQVAKSFYNDNEYVSVSTQGTSTITDSVSGDLITIQAVFVPTFVYVKQIVFGEEEGNPELIPFTLQLWVAGS